MQRTVLFVTAALAAASVPVAAHHTFVTKYDNAKTVTISGEIGSVSFSNPHIFFDVGGWSVETEGVAVALAKGLTKERLKSGAKATVTGWPSRNGSKSLGLKTITFAGGPSITMRGSAR